MTADAGYLLAPQQERVIDGLRRRCEDVDGWWKADAERFRVQVVVRPRAPIAVTTVAERVRVALDRHSVLRLRLTPRPGARRPLQCLVDGTAMDPLAAGVVQVAAASCAEVCAAQWRRPFDLRTEAPLRVVCVGEGAAMRLVLTASALALDARAALDLVRELCGGPSVAAAGREHSEGLDWLGAAAFFRELLEDQGDEEARADRAYFAAAASRGGQPASWPLPGPVPVTAQGSSDSAESTHVVSEAKLALGWGQGGHALGAGRARALPERIPAGYVRVPVPLPAQVFAALAAEARRRGVSEETLWLAAAFAFVARTSDIARPLLRVASGGRAVEGLESLLGPLSRFLPLCAAVDPSAPVGVLAAALASEVAASREHALGHRDPDPFQRDVAARGELDAFAFARIDTDLMGAGTVETLRAVEVDAPLLVLVTGAGEAAELTLEVDAARVDADAAARLAASLSHWLSSVARAPAAAIREHALLAPGPERARALGEPYRTPSGPPTPFLERFARAARAAPERPAVIADRGALSYAQLDQRTRQLAQQLRAAGAGPERPVALVMSRTEHAVVAMLGAMRAGAPYLPLDPALPAEAIGFRLRDAAVVVVLTEANLLARVPEGWPRWPLDAQPSVAQAPPDPQETAPIAPAPADAQETAPIAPVPADGQETAPIAPAPADGQQTAPIAPVPADAQEMAPIAPVPADAQEMAPTPIEPVPPESAAYLLYTSGSTGTPKAVVVEHRQLSAYIAAVEPIIGAGPGACWGNLSTLAADLGHTTLFPALATGGTLRLLGEEAMGNARVLADHLRGCPVDVLKIVPSHLTALLDGAGSAEASRALLPSRALICGGERLPRDLVERVRAIVDGSAPPCKTRPDVSEANPAAGWGPAGSAGGAGRARALPGEQLCEGAIVDGSAPPCETRPDVSEANPAGWAPAGFAGRAGRARALPGEEAGRARALPGERLAPMLLNHYGPTEATVGVAAGDARSAPPDAGGQVPLGRPLGYARLYVLDRTRAPVPVGMVGELFLGGPTVARGYHGRPALTAERFLPDPFAHQPGARMYRTGDLARRLADGSLVYVGRTDFQIKVRGFRVEPGEIEAVIAAHPDVAQALVKPVEDGVRGPDRLAAWVVPQSGARLSAAELRAWVKSRLSVFMRPSAWVVLRALPLTANGKVDRAALPAPDTSRPELDSTFVPPRGQAEREIAAMWCELLQLDRVGAHDNFFDLGGHSLLLVQLMSKLEARFARDILITELFRYPTVAALARWLTAGGPGDAAAPRPVVRALPPATADLAEPVAVVGMAARFPDAPSIDAYWENLRAGHDCVRRFDREALRAAGVDAALLDDPRFVAAGPVLDGIDHFDASFFGIPPRQAQIMDPQHRLLLEVAWAALEHAGVAPGRSAGRVGVFAGAGVGTYFLRNLVRAPQLLASVGVTALRHANRIDNLATRVAYHLDLNGPAVTVQSGCSSSLVAVHLAAQSLRTGDADVALAGGVTVDAGQGRGYRHQPGGINAPDGRCRAFDAAAAGTVFGSGVGMVTLKRLRDALADGDTVHALVLGSAMNNDGAGKPGYTAPSIDGQAAVVAEALARAGVSPADLDFVEAHGTGTLLGDPVEVAALTRAFGDAGGRRSRCALGSVKSNFGHLDAAAGIAGFLKAVLALSRGEIPPTLHFEQPNPRLKLERTPFRIATELSTIARPAAERRAGVSSFGIGGTNVHVVLGGPPPAPTDATDRAPRHAACTSARGARDPDPAAAPEAASVLVLSARSEAALDQITGDLAQHLRQHPDARLHDVAWTLAIGRRPGSHRRAVVCTDRDQALAALSGWAPERVRSCAPRVHDADVAFLFPGQGAQRPGMAARLHRTDAAFRSAFDAALSAVQDALAQLGDPDPAQLRRLLLDTDAVDGVARLADTRLAQPALFVVELALADAWVARGVRPVAMLGHSLGEWVAATHAGVFSLADAASLVALRGQLLAAQPTGAMLAVRAGARELTSLLASPTGDDVFLSAVNGASDVTVGGSASAIAAFAARLERAGFAFRRLATSHAFHVPHMQGAVAPFAEAVAAAARHAPRVPFVSGRTGTWIRDEEATCPQHWAAQLVEPVRFADALAALGERFDGVGLEVGPGRALASLARRAVGLPVVASLPDGPEDHPLSVALAELWLHGASLDWARALPGGRGRRLPLPTYPFARERHWIDPAPGATLAQLVASASAPPSPSAEPTRAADDARAPAAQRPARGAAYAPPTSETERTLVAIWEQVLGSAEIGIHDNFFELGGDSVQGLQVLALVRDAGHELGPEALYERQTIAALAEVMHPAAVLPASGAAAHVPVRPSVEPAESRHSAGEVGPDRGQQVRALHAEPAASSDSGGEVGPGRGQRVRALQAEAAESRHSGGEVGPDRGQQVRALHTEPAASRHSVREANPALGWGLDGSAFGAGRARALLAESNIEDVYPLTPAQEGMLFHTLGSPRSGVYVQQLWWTLEGELDAQALTRAWGRVAARHAVLRTSFHWKDLERPCQRVHRQAVTPLIDQDLRDLSAAAQQARLAALLEQDRQAGFDLTRPPAVRIQRYRLAERSHRIVLTYHHILLDGWSVPIVSRELLLALTAERAGRPLNLPSPRPFGEHVRRVVARDAAAAREHWRQRLAGFREPSRADLLRRALHAPAAQVADATVTKAAAKLDPAAAQRLSEAAREAGVTLGTMVMGAWSIALSALSGRTDVLFGVTTSGRDADSVAHAAPTVGMCLTTLPLRADVAERKPLRAWLRDLQRRQAEDRRFDHVPLAELRGLSELASDASLFDTIVVVGNTPLHALSQAADRLSGLADLRITELGDFEKTHYPLTLLVSPRSGLSVEALGGSDSDPGAIARAASLLVFVLGRMADGLDAPPGRVPLTPVAPFSGTEIAAFPPFRGFRPRYDDLGTPEGRSGSLTADLALDSGGELGEPAALALTDPWAAIAARGVEHADDIALVSGRRTLRYGALIEAARGRAAELSQAGVRAGDRVAIAAEPGPAFVEAVLSVWCAGATCVPLDPAQPPGRRARILDHARPRALLVTPTFADVLARDKAADALGDLPRIDLATPAAAAPGRTAPAHDPARAAYVLYTSGSTGEPKGVVLPVSTLARLVAWQNERSGAAACAVTLALAPVGFDVAFQELLSTLVAGGRLVLVDAAVRRDPSAILDQIEAHGVTRLFAPFVLLDALARVAETRPRAPTTLREIVTAGEALRVTEPIRQLFRRLAGAVLDNQYGPTETHVVTAHRLSGDPAAWDERPPIGRPLPGTRLYVLDRLGRPLPDGIVGELVLAGHGLAHGYLNAPARTAERFVPDPFHAGGGGEGLRAYRTGDLVRRRADGVVEFVGRADAQVKLRGFRVELGEIEAVLARHPGVQAAAVCLRTGADDAQGARLVAYLVDDARRPASDGELRAHLEHELPPYMLPDAIVRLSALPLTPNGKVDRRALPAPASSRLDAGSKPGAGVEPRTETERLVAELWGRVLEQSRVGAHDDFFDLGGHSLSALRAVSLLGTALGREVSVVQLFEHPTPARLAGWIEASARGDDASEPEPSRRALPERRPLSEAQRRLFTLHRQCAPTHRFYHTVTARRLRGPLDVGALTAAFERVVRRHEPLRTAYEVRRLAPLDVVKRVRSAEPFSLAWVDLSGQPPAKQERAVRARADADFEAPFDLAAGQLLRATLLRLADHHHVLVVVCHQLAFDAWSRELLLREIEVHYAAASGRSPAARDVHEPPLRYDDLAAAEAERRDAAPAQRRLELATARLAGPCEPLAFETDRPRPPIKSFEGFVLPVRIPPGLVAQVRELARSAGVTLYMALLSLYAVWLHAYSGQRRIRVGSSTARRRGAAAEQLIGPFNDFLVLPLDLDGDPSFGELMARVRKVALEAHAHGEVPFARLVDALGGDDDPSRTPLYQAMFTYKRFLERPEGRLGDLVVEGVHVDWRTARTDVTLSLLDDGEEIVGFLEASADLFEREPMLQRLRHAQVLLEAVVRDPCAPLSALPLAPAEARRYASLSSLSEGEQRYLRAFEERYTRRTDRSRRLAAAHHGGWADERFAAGYRGALRKLAYPVFAERAEGAHIYDLDGNAYVDLTMSFGITLFGHRPAFLRDALVAEVERGFPLGMASPRAAEAAERIRRLAPADRVAFFGTRTEAMIVGVRACRAETGRSTVVVFRGGYHGNADEMQFGGRPFEPDARPPGIPAALAGDVLVLDYGDPRSLARIEARAGELAAVLVEPVHSQIAARLADDVAPFLTELRALTARVEVPLVFDETVFGFRIHPAGCQGHFGIAADLAVYGKPVGGGLPVGVLAGRRALLDRIDGGPWLDQDGGAPASDRIAAGSTYGGHPLSMTAVCAVLEELERRGPGFQRALNQRTSALCERLNGWLQAEGAPLTVTHFGSRFGLASLSGADLGPLLRLHLLERGVYLRGDCGSLSAAHDDHDLEVVERAVCDSVRALKAAGFRA